MHLFSQHPNSTAVSARIGNHRHTEEDTHQRRFSRAVFSYQSDHFSCMDIKADTLQYGRTRKFLCDMID